MAGAAGGKFAKGMYLVLVFFSAVVALGLRYYGAAIDNTFSNATSHFKDIHLETHCTGFGAVYRISLVMCLFFLVMMALTCVSEKFHRGMWGPKLVLYVAALTGSVFLSNNIFDQNGYAWFARVASVLFLVMQVIALIGFAYDFNEALYSKAEAKNDEDAGTGNKWFILNVVLAMGGLVVSVVGLGLLFSFFTDSLSIFFTAATLVAVVFFTVLSLSDRSNGSLLSSSIVATYAVYLNWGAVSSNPAEQGGNLLGADDTVSMLIGMAIACLSLVWTCYSGALSFETVVTSGKTSPAPEDGQAGNGQREQLLRTPAVASPGAAGQHKGSGDGGDLRHNSSSMDKEDIATTTVVTEPTGESEGDDLEAGAAGSAETTTEVKEKIWLFHLFVATGCVYMAMLFTDWGAADSSNNMKDLGKNHTSMWVKIISQWITIGMYTWTLIAPLVCPHRFHSVDQDDE